jgi:7,8-dihydroneopterin aldolase/epimerase/oxygenase
MAIIALEGMRFFAYHGLYEEEQLMGTHFILDIELKTDVTFANTIEEHEVDKVIGTINYETVYEICKIEMSKPQKLLETVVKNIMVALKWQFQNIFQLRIKIKKLNPPVGGTVASSSIEVEESYLKQCGRCGSPLVCYKLPSCWCTTVKANIHPRTMEMLTTQFKGCLCGKCLEEYAG